MAGGSANLCARLTGNVSDRYNFFGFSTLPIMVENLPGLSGPDNSGATNTTGTVINTAIDSCGIPAI